MTTPVATAAAQRRVLVMITLSELVRAPYGEVEKALTNRPEHLMTLAFPTAPAGKASASAVLTTRILGDRVKVPIDLELIRSLPEPRRADAVMSVRWQPLRFARLFPLMSADLVVRSVSVDCSELALIGEYKPPFGLLGLVADELLGGRVAVSTTQLFLKNLGAALERDTAKGC